MYFHFRSFTEFINVDNLLRITAIILLQMSEPSDEHAAMQQYLVCGTENCLKNAQFYCNDCHRPLCEQCSDEHKRVLTPKNMKLSFTDIANISFLWKCVKTIQQII